HLGSVVTKLTPFTARNDAYWTDGAFVYVPRGVEVDAPIVLSTLHEQAGTTLHWRALVVLEWSSSSARMRGCGSSTRRTSPRSRGSSARSARPSPATARSTGSRSASARRT